MPECYYMGIGIYWAIENYAATGYKNYVALLAVWLMFLQLIYKNRLLGIIYGGALSIISLFMISAVFSEFREVQAVEGDYGMLLGVGLGMFGMGLLMALWMVIRSAMAKHDYDESVLTVHY